MSHRTKVIAQTAGFLLVLAVTFIMLETKARGMYRTRTDLFRKFELLDTYAPDIECLALGSSHAAKGIDPNFLGMRGFNAAFSAQDLYYDMKIFEDYIDRMRSLKVVLVCLDIRGFGYDESVNVPYLVKDYYACRGYRPRNGFGIGFILSLSEFWLHKETFFQDLLAGKKADNHVWAFHNGFTVPPGGLANSTLLASGLRFAPGTKSEAGFKAHGARACKGHLGFYREAAVPSNMQCLSRMIELGRERGIRVILYTPPYSHYYTDLFPLEFINDFHAHVADVKSRHPGIEYYDFSRMKIPPELFFNSNHLNYRGAEAFSRFLGTSILAKKPAPAPAAAG